MSEELEIPLKNLREWLERETVPIVEPLKAEVTSLLDDFRDRLDDVREICEKLLEDGEREMSRSNPKTYRRAREAYRLARSILETIDDTSIPEDVSYENLQTFCEDFKKTLSTIGRERAKRFPRISPYFIIDRRRLDVALKKIVDSVEELRSFLFGGYKKAKAVEDSFSMIDKLLQLLDELGVPEKRMKKMELERGALEKKIAENQQKIALIKSKDEIGELEQINIKIKELEKSVKHDLRHLQKPFLKFQSLVRGPSYSLPLDETKKLGEYLSNPFKALATEDEGCPSLKGILQKMEDAMAKKKMKLKSSRLRKAQQKINEITRKDTLTSLHQSCKETFSQRQHLSTSEAMAAFQNKLRQLQKNLRQLEKRKELMDSKRAVLESTHEKIMEKIKNQRRELEKTILELTDKNVRVG
jgi:predicted  nucleic acid-binding Zn-ribbon protein